jgi:hypothetical protein
MTTQGLPSTLRLIAVFSIVIGSLGMTFAILGIISSTSTGFIQNVDQMDYGILSSELQSYTTAQGTINVFLLLFYSICLVSGLALMARKFWAVPAMILFIVGVLVSSTILLIVDLNIESSLDLVSKRAADTGSEISSGVRQSSSWMTFILNIVYPIILLGVLAKRNVRKALQQKDFKLEQDHSKND